MLNTRPIFSAAIFAVAGLLLLIILLVSPASNLASSLSEADLQAKALTLAQTYGLNGSPTSETYGFTTLGMWLTKNNENIGAGSYPRDTRVFVYQVQGSITLRMLGYYMPDQRYETLVITLFAEDGTHFGTSAHPAGATPPNLQPVPDIGSPVNIPTPAPYEPGNDD